ncbi:MAG: DUF4126 domain-containing protein [Anaerolineaceae bacterium]|nr:DUF4126 domain-containing protein [Anaerolineaceae bacterium]
MDVLGIFSAFGLSASAGLNAYIPLLVVALLAKFTDLIQLSKPYDTLTSWWIIALLVVLSLVEFFADKVPAVNHINDVVQTIIRPAAGAIVFASSAKVISDVNPVLAIALGLLVAGSVHTVKSVVVRPVVTATTGGTANIAVSMIEDGVSTAVSVLSLIIPVIMAGVLLLVTVWVIWWLLRRTKRRAAKKANSSVD